MNVSEATRTAHLKGRAITRVAQKEIPTIVGLELRSNSTARSATPLGRASRRPLVVAYAFRARVRVDRETKQHSLLLVIKTRVPARPENRLRNRSGYNSFKNWNKKKM